MEAILTNVAAVLFEFCIANPHDLQVSLMAFYHGNLEIYPTATTRFRLQRFHSMFQWRRMYQHMKNEHVVLRAGLKAHNWHNQTTTRTPLSDTSVLCIVINPRSPSTILVDQQDLKAKRNFELNTGVHKCTLWINECMQLVGSNPWRQSSLAVTAFNVLHVFKLWSQVGIAHISGLIKLFWAHTFTRFVLLSRDIICNTPQIGLFDGNAFHKKDSKVFRRDTISFLSTSTRRRDWNYARNYLRDTPVNTGK